MSNHSVKIMFSFKKQRPAATPLVETEKKNMITQFAGNLFCPPEPGHVLVIGGKTVDAAERLDIELRAGKALEDDVLLLISIRFHSDTVVRNAKVHGAWGEDEIEDHVDSMVTSNPLAAGDRFRVYVLVAADRFHIALNDMHYCTFTFRGDVGDIRTVKVSKDVQMIHQVDHRRVYPSPSPLVQNNDDFLSFSNDVPSHFSPGHAMIITAIPYGNPKGRFIISFYEKDTKKQALHFNPRFEPSNIVIRNSTKEDMSFREEERHGDFPFVFDQQFKLAFAMSSTHFLVAVDGKRFCSYKYRTQNQLEVVNGFKMFCLDGLRLEVAGVDHIYTGSTTCMDFEGFSNPDTELY